MSSTDEQNKTMTQGGLGLSLAVLVLAEGLVLLQALLKDFSGVTHIKYYTILYYKNLIFHADFLFCV